MIQIDAPVAYELNQDSALPGGDELEIINSKQLYSQFMRLVDQKNINFVTQAQAKQQQQLNQFAAKNDDDLSLV